MTACFESGRAHVLTGPSGSGKTTLLRLLAGLETPDAGEVGRSGVARLAMTFQEDRLCDNLTVTANVRLPHARLRGAERAAFLELEREACAAVGLPCDARPVRELSGGQRRRVSILRCVLADADAFLFDEPLKGMDEKTVDAVMDFVVPRLAGYTDPLGHPRRARALPLRRPRPLARRGRPRHLVLVGAPPGIAALVRLRSGNRRPCRDAF